jgi:hypothetical protein
LGHNTILWRKSIQGIIRVSIESEIEELFPTREYYNGYKKKVSL